MSDFICKKNRTGWKPLLFHQHSLKQSGHTGVCGLDGSHVPSHVFLLQKRQIYTLCRSISDSAKRPGASDSCQQSSRDWSCWQKLTDCCCSVQLLTAERQRPPLCRCTLSVQEEVGTQCLWCSCHQLRGGQVQFCVGQGLCCTLTVWIVLPWAHTMEASACGKFCMHKHMSTGTVTCYTRACTHIHMCSAHQTFSLKCSHPWYAISMREVNVFVKYTRNLSFRAADDVGVVLSLYPRKPAVIVVQIFSFCFCILNLFSEGAGT